MCDINMCIKLLSGANMKAYYLEILVVHMIPKIYLKTEHGN